MRYLDNAPPALIQLYERGQEIDDNRSPHLPDTPQSLLKKLLCAPEMKPAWNIIGKSVERNDGYEKLFEAIIESMRIARRGIVSQTERREKYEDIATRAEKLAGLIAEPQRLPRDGSPPLYRGELDLQIYELLPEDVASILGAKSYSKMKSDERSDCAYSHLRAWPTMVDLLNQLAFRARQCGSEPESSGGRNRGKPEPRVTNTRVRLFSRHLYDYLRKIDPAFKGFAAIANIASVAYRIKLNSNNLRTVILGTSRKLQVKKGSKSDRKL